jgi:hypothetical protein
LGGIRPSAAISALVPSNSFPPEVFAMTKPSKRDAVQEAHANFYLVYGAAVAAWARVEQGLYFWFERVSGMHPKTARQVFYSGKSFNARADMFAAVMHAPHLLPHRKEFMKAALNKARQYSEFRNITVHGETYLAADGPNVDQVVLIDGKRGEHQTTIDDLMVATMNFKRLADSLMDALSFHQNKAPDEIALLRKHLELIRAMPNQAHSTTSSQTAAKPRPRPSPPQAKP